MLKLVKLRLSNFLKSEEIFYALAVFFILIVDNLLEIRKVLVNVDLNISPFILPLVSSNSSFRYFILFTSVLLFLNAPFLDGYSKSYINKFSKRRLNLSNILYILLISLFFVIASNLITLLFFIDRLVFIKDWGIFITSMARSSGSINIFNNYIVSRFSGLEAFMIFNLIFYLEVILIGIIVYVFNLYNHKIHLGPIVAGIYILSDSYNKFLGNPTFDRFFPSNYLNLCVIAKDKVYKSLTYTRASKILLLIIIFLGLLSFFIFRKKENLYE